ncbi:MAG: hypothetical protein JNL01_08980 [Bdellovibrionales bacterium]|nr:hypothetical protein [Bdellovibrionales bacterium]
MKKILALFIFSTILAGCSKLSTDLREPRVKTDLTAQKEPFAVLPETLRGKAIRDFVTIVFKKGFDRTRWLQVFDKTKSLSKIRNDLIVLDDRLTELETDGGFDRDSKLCTPYDATDPVRFEQPDDLKSCLQDTKLTLYADMGIVVEDIRQNDAAFIMVLDETYKCGFSNQSAVTHSCDVSPNNRKTQERLGGLPDVTTAWFVQKPTAADIWIYPWLEARTRSTEDSPGKFELTYRLRAEAAYLHSLKWVGEIEVSDGSFFTTPGQPGVVIDHDRFGYTELTIRK